ncbi:hypothetical protein [Solwaraspora sp. WMMA2101]|uniref:hypothetical protein n=1 Tax=Solwaraspora sp. WMMA2101 TaxID=3404124 RepID=UPI003B92D412
MVDDPLSGRRARPAGGTSRTGGSAVAKLPRSALTDKGRTGIAQVEAAWCTLATGTD